jgi:flavin reductase (DIM6/NTAB) family NADH-FMN oxidoreductase RutF
VPQLKVKRKMGVDIPSVASDAYRAAMRQLPGGVSIIAAGQGGDRTGMTVNSLASLSLDPPTLIVSVSRQSSIRPLLDRYRAFGASVLRAAQSSVAERFAGYGGVKGNSRFIGEKWIALETGAPLLADALALFDCEIEDIIDRHTHSIVIGEVKAVRFAAQGSALIHWQGQYSVTGVDESEGVLEWQ